MLRGIPEELQCTIDHLCNMHPAEVARHRLENLKKWMSRAKELEPVDARLKELMPRHCREILSNKRLQLFKEMLEASGHKDLSLVSDMSKPSDSAVLFPSVMPFVPSVPPQPSPPLPSRNRPGRLGRA